jgi:hypothetical protein
MVSPQVSLLARYLPDKSVFRCPADKPINSSSFRRPKNYGLNFFIGWTPDAITTSNWHGEPMGRNQIFTKVSGVPKPRDLFLFGEIHPFSICQPAFGSHPTWDISGNATGSNRSFHVPANLHGRLSIFSMADGHAEIHVWRNALFNDPHLSNGEPVTETDVFWHNHDTSLTGVKAASVVPDFKWLAEHATVPWDLSQ